MVKTPTCFRQIPSDVTPRGKAVVACVLKRIIEGVPSRRRWHRIEFGASIQRNRRREAVLLISSTSDLQARAR